MERFFNSSFLDYFGLSNHLDLNDYMSNLLNTETKLMGVFEKKECAETILIDRFISNEFIMKSLVGVKLSSLVDGTLVLIDSKIMSLAPSIDEIDSVLRSHMSELYNAEKFIYGLYASDDIFLDISHKRVFSGDEQLKFTENIDFSIEEIGKNMIIDLDGLLCLNIKVPIGSMPRIRKKI